MLWEGSATMPWGPACSRVGERRGRFWVMRGQDPVGFVVKLRCIAARQVRRSTGGRGIRRCVRASSKWCQPIRRACSPCKAVVTGAAAALMAPAATVTGASFSGSKASCRSSSSAHPSCTNSHRQGGSSSVAWEWWRLLLRGS